MARKNALPAPGDQTIVVGDSSTLRGGKQKKRGSAPTGCSVASTLPINDVPGSNGGLYVIDAPNNQAGSAKDHEGTPNTVPLDDDAWVMTLDLAGGARVSIKQDPQNSHRFWIDAGTSNATKTGNQIDFDSPIVDAQLYRNDQDDNPQQFGQRPLTIYLPKVTANS